MQTAQIWDNWTNAEIYREYAERSDIHRALNQRLVELAELASARRVLDLACGTGATTSACLAQLPAEAEIEAVDSAETMLEAARVAVGDPRARFVRANAGAVDEALAGRFDRVVCNAAFWQFPSPHSVLRALGNVLAPGGRLVFNVPSELVVGGAIAPDPFQLSLACAVIERTGFRPPSPRRLDWESTRTALEENGFLYRGLHSFVYRGRQRELMDLMRVPALAIQLAPDLGYDACLDIVRHASERNNPRLEVNVPWDYVVAVRGET